MTTITRTTIAYESPIQRMDRKAKRKWLKALRSGTYAQIKGKLRKTDPYTYNTKGFCCLGVLCEVSDNIDVQVNGSDTYVDTLTKESSAKTLPKTFAARLKIKYRKGMEKGKWGFLNVNNPTLFFVTTQGSKGWDNGHNNEPINLADLNDQGFAFSQIADLIDYFL